MELNDEVVELIIARIEAMPGNLQVHLGNHKTLDKEDMLKEVKSRSHLGKLIIQNQLNYLRALKVGI